MALDHITKVRAYTAAALKTDGSGAFTTASIFGETSAEVCGIYGVNGTGGKAATKLPTVKKGDTVVPTQNMELKPCPWMQTLLLRLQPRRIICT